MIALGVVVPDILAHCSSKKGFTDWNDLSQTLRFDRSNESLGVRVQVRAAAREPHGTYARAIEHFSERFLEQRIAIGTLARLPRAGIGQSTPQSTGDQPPDFGNVLR